MVRKLPPGVNFVESCKIAAWFERVRDKLGDVKNPKDISASQLTAWIKFNHYDFDMESKEWSRTNTTEKPKDPPKEQRDEEE
jgi:hypothetical protein